MGELIFAAEQGRNIPKEDKIFGISNRAKKRIAQDGKDKVVNATIGALLDDDGELIVLSSVTDVFRNLKPEEFSAAVDAVIAADCGHGGIQRGG